MSEITKLQVRKELLFIMKKIVSILIKILKGSYLLELQKKFPASSRVDLLHGMYFEVAM